MGFLSRLGDFAQLAGHAWQISGSPDWRTRTQTNDTTLDGLLWGDQLRSVPSVTGIAINQQTALNAAAVMACVTMIAEDVAKLPVALFRRLDDGGRQRLKKKDHWLVPLLRKPNPWQNWMEFCEMLQCGLIMRGNGYAVIIRNARGIPTMLVPINPDRVSLWEGQDGGLWYRVTPFGLHEMAMLKDQPFLIPFDDVLHIRGFSVNGLMGASRIALAREAIGLTLGQERQAAQWLGNGARPSGILTTEQKLSDATIERAKTNWKNLHAGLQNSGKTAILEAGLKWTPLTMNSHDLEFIASRQFQLQEIARIFRVPPHKIGELSKGTNNNITQQSQEYVNDTISGYTTRWKRKFDEKFDLDEDDELFLDFDLSAILEGDLVARYNVHRVGIMSGFLSRNEARRKEGFNPVPEAEALWSPLNMADAGSQATGGGADDGGGAGTSGRPEDGTTKAYDYENGMVP
jgi:HK97 family phage portal protein